MNDTNGWQETRQPASIVPNETHNTSVLAPSRRRQQLAFGCGMSKAVVPSWVEPASLVGLVPAGLGLPGAALVQAEVVPLWVHQLWTSQPPDHNQPIIITHGEAEMLHCIAFGHTTKGIARSGSEVCTGMRWWPVNKHLYSHLKLYYGKVAVPALLQGLNGSGRQ